MSAFRFCFTLAIFCLAQLVSFSALARGSQAATPFMLTLPHELNLWDLNSPVIWPVAGHSSISSRFGMRQHPVGGGHKRHLGVDIAARSGTPIVAIALGKVVFAGWRRGYGQVVDVDHGDGWVSRYAHAKHLVVRPGQSVLAGQMIGQVGSSGQATGAHLHLELLKSGHALNPLALWSR